MSVKLTRAEVNKDKGGTAKKEEKVREDPEEVLEKIRKLLKSQSQHTVINCRWIRVGSYKVTDANANTGTIPLRVTFTELGIMFNLPLANSKHVMKTVCIPNQQILSIQANLTKKLPILFLKTGPKYARWIRGAIGMDGSPEDKHSNYYCPAHGNSSQRAIAILVGGSFADADVGILRTLYGDKLKEIDYDKANQYLMNMTSDSYGRSSIGYKPDPGSPAAAATSDDSDQAVVSAIKPEKAEQTAGTTSPVSSVPDNNNVTEPESPILFYKGPNIRIPISAKDLTCLGDSELLNDVIIDFWLSVIHNEILSEVDRKRTFVFDNFFFSKLMEKRKKRAEDANLNGAERSHARVAKRTKDVDIFEKDFLIVPINLDRHWLIAIVCFPGMNGVHDYDTMEPLHNYSYKRPKGMSTENSEPPPPTKPEAPMIPSGSKRKVEDGAQRVKQPCILLFDSLAAERARVFSVLRDYLTVEYKAKKNEKRLFDKTTMPATMPKVPQQPNFYDGGLYMLQYMESFFSNPLPTYDKKAVSLKNWFEPKLAERKRKVIYDFIRKRIGEQCPQNLGRVPEVNFDPNETMDDEEDSGRHGSSEDESGEEEEGDDNSSSSSIRVIQKPKNTILITL